MLCAPLQTQSRLEGLQRGARAYGNEAGSWSKRKWGLKFDTRRMLEKEAIQRKLEEEGAGTIDLNTHTRRQEIVEKLNEGRTRKRGDLQTEQLKELIKVNEGRNPDSPIPRTEPRQASTEDVTPTSRVRNPNKPSTGTEPRQAEYGDGTPTQSGVPTQRGRTQARLEVFLQSFSDCLLYPAREQYEKLFETKSRIDQFDGNRDATQSVSATQEWVGERCADCP